MSQRTRKEAQQERRRREAEERRLLEGGTSTSIPPLDSEGTILGRRGLRYKVSQLQSPVRGTAIRGLKANNINAVISRAHTDPKGVSYVAIQVVERLRLCIYPDRPEGRRLDCNCADFKSRASVACAHIYWLYDRINSLYSPSTPPAIWSTNLRDIERAFERVTNQSKSEIDRLAEKINPTWSEPDGDVDHEVEDILSVLDPERGRLAVDYDEEFYSALPQSPECRIQDLVVAGDIFSTVFSLARHDLIFRERLSLAIPREKSTRDFLRKLYRRRDSCFLQLDLYKQQGPFKLHQIEETSSKLQDIIQKMSEYRQRIHDNSHPAFDRACARLTTKILANVCYWNQDIYVNSSWLEGQPPTLLQDRNLFTSLVSNLNEAAVNENHDVFDFLIEELPAQASIANLPELTKISRKFREFNTPRFLIVRLDNFIHELQELQDLQVQHQQQPLGEIENNSSPSSTGRAPRNNSQSSNDNCGSSGSEPLFNGAPIAPRLTRQPSSLELPDAQRRRLQ